MASDIQLSEVLQTAFEAMLSNINTCLPGEIQEYDYTKSKASVKPMLYRKLKDGSRQILPILINVPVIFPRTKNKGITFPISKGDGCLILFSQRSLERWKSTTGIAEPGDPRKFDLTDAICIPGLFQFGANTPQSNNTDVEIKNGSNKIILKSNGDVEIGGGTLSKLVNESFLTLFDSHTHTGVTTGPGVSGPPAILSSALNLTSKTKAS